MPRKIGWAQRAEIYLRLTLEEFRHEVAWDLQSHGEGCPRYKGARALVELCGYQVDEWLAQYWAS